MEIFFNNEPLNSEAFFPVFETSTIRRPAPRTFTFETPSRSGRLPIAPEHSQISKFLLVMHVTGMGQDPLSGREALERNLDELETLLSPYGRQCLLRKEYSDGFSIEAIVERETEPEVTIIGRSNAQVKYLFTLPEGSWRDWEIQQGPVPQIFTGTVAPTRDWQLTLTPDPDASRHLVAVGDETTGKILSWMGEGVQGKLVIDALAARAWDESGERTRELVMPPGGFDFHPRNPDGWWAQYWADDVELEYTVDFLSFKGRRRY